MKYIFTGCDPYLQPDLHRKLVICPDWISLTMDAPDINTGRMRLNGTMKFKRHAGYESNCTIERNSKDTALTRYVIRTGYQQPRLHILAYDNLPYELTTGLEMFDPSLNSFRYINTPYFTLDNSCRAAWRAFVDEALRFTSLQELSGLAKLLTHGDPYAASIGLLASKLTPTEIM